MARKYLHYLTLDLPSQPFQSPTTVNYVVVGMDYVVVGMDYVVVGMDYVVVGMNSVLVAPVNCCSIAYLYSCYLCNTGVAVGAD
jgi:hypothetical protein